MTVETRWMLSYWLTDLARVLDFKVVSSDIVDPNFVNTLAYFNRTWMETI